MGPRGGSLREHPIAGSSSCATRLGGHLAHEIAEGFRCVRTVLTVTLSAVARWPVARYSAPVWSRFRLPGVMEQTFSVWLESVLGLAADNVCYLGLC